MEETQTPKIELFVLETGCPTCTAAKQMLVRKQVEYECKVIETDITLEDLHQLTGGVRLQAPVILVDGKLTTFPELVKMF